MARLNRDEDFSSVDETAQRILGGSWSLSERAKEAAARKERASGRINVKAYDPNKRIIPEIYRAASRVVNSARSREKEEGSNNTGKGRTSTPMTRMRRRRKKAR